MNAQHLLIIFGKLFLADKDLIQFSIHRLKSFKIGLELAMWFP